LWAGSSPRVCNSDRGHRDDFPARRGRFLAGKGDAGGRSCRHNLFARTVTAIIHPQGAVRATRCSSGHVAALPRVVRGLGVRRATDKNYAYASVVTTVRRSLGRGRGYAAPAFTFLAGGRFFQCIQRASFLWRLSAASRSQRAVAARLLPRPRRPARTAARTAGRRRPVVRAAVVRTRRLPAARALRLAQRVRFAALGCRASRR
jgi:hypothetical protein